MVGGCCVCSDDRGWSENPLVYCDGQSCTVAVHQACYGIVTVPTGPWYCRKCESQERSVKVVRFSKTIVKAPLLSIHSFCRNANYVRANMVLSNEPTIPAGLTLFVHCTYRKCVLAMLPQWNRSSCNWFQRNVSVNCVIFAKKRGKRPVRQSVLVCNATGLVANNNFTSPVPKRWDCCVRKPATI